MKRVLFDTCVPRPLRKCLSKHNVRRAQDEGWGALKNGELLIAAAAGGFDVFLTSDKNLQYQQNLKNRAIAVVVLPTNDWPTLKNRTTEIAHAVDIVQPGQYVELI